MTFRCPYDDLSQRRRPHAEHRPLDAEASVACLQRPRLQVPAHVRPERVEDELQPRAREARARDQGHD